MIGRATLSARVRRLAAIAEGLDPEPEHAAQVTWLAGRLFGELAPEHGLGPDEFELLLAAGVVHDIGWSVSPVSHHRSSSQMIEEMALPDFTDREQAIIAALARYHRKALPRKKHRIFGGLKKRDRRAVRKLAAILRVADGLDRTHDNVVRDVSVERDDEALRIVAHVTEDAGPELWAARKKSDLFEDVFGPVEIDCAADR